MRRLGNLHSRWVKVRGLPLHARISTDPVPADHLPIVLVHGLGISSRYMIPLARHLAPDFRVYAPDLPGFGESGKPPHALTVAELADALVEWMAASGIGRAVLVGNSLGCQIIEDAAVRYPARADRLVLLGPTADAAARTAPQQVARIALNARHESPSLGWLSLTDYLKAGLPRVLQTLRYLLQDRIEDKLPRTEAPVLVVRGARDAIVPQPWAEQVARLLPRARLVVIPGAAHAVNFSAPLEVARIMRPFLSGRGTPAGVAAPASLAVTR